MDDEAEKDRGGSLAAQGEHGIYVELKFKDPNGITFDVAEGGWPGISH